MHSLREQTHAGAHVARRNPKGCLHLLSAPDTANQIPLQNFLLQKNNNEKSITTTATADAELNDEPVVGAVAICVPRFLSSVVVGSTNWGKTSTSTASGTRTDTPSTWDTIARLMSAAGAFLPTRKPLG
jgi:hypothetical protein